MDIRSKARTLSGSLDDPQKLLKWNYDGSSTGQAHGHHTSQLYGLEQEYTLMDDTKWPLGWPRGGFPRPQVII
ncbi:putative glutamine synthetase [Helianthus annuus]|nr:putative glutamine synthetase [Helianthus annuus]